MNWQNIKGNKSTGRKKKDRKINKPQETPADYSMYQIHKEIKGLPIESMRNLFDQHLGQINYLPSIKEAIIFQPPSYANASTPGWDRKLVVSTKWGWQYRGVREAVMVVSFWAREVNSLLDMEALLTFYWSTNELILFV